MSHKNPIIIITGANGFVGAELTQYFKKLGWQVRALVHTLPTNPIRGVEYTSYSLAEPFDETIFKDADYLIHAAYVKQTRQHSDSMKVNVNGAKQLMKISHKYGLRHCVFISSMSAHAKAVSVYGKQKLAIEKIFNEAGGTSLRSGLIIGNGGIVKQMVDFMRSKHIVPVVGGGNQPLQIISIYDLAKVMEIVLSKNITDTLTVAHPHIYSYKVFYKKLGRHIRTRIILVPVPFTALLAVVKTILWLHLPLAVNEDNLLGLKKLQSVDTSQDLDKLGITLDSLDQALDRVGTIK